MVPLVRQFTKQPKQAHTKNSEVYYFKREKDVLEFTLMINFEKYFMRPKWTQKNKGKIGKQVRMNTGKKEQEEKRVGAYTPSWVSGLCQAGTASFWQGCACVFVRNGAYVCVSVLVRGCVCKGYVLKMWRWKRGKIDSKRRNKNRVGCGGCGVLGAESSSKVLLAAVQGWIEGLNAECFLDVQS